MASGQLTYSSKLPPCKWKAEIAEFLVHKIGDKYIFTKVYEYFPCHLKMCIGIRNEYLKPSNVLQTRHEEAVQQHVSSVCQ